jgi:predicted PurR-regulated permease PerM
MNLKRQVVFWVATLGVFVALLWLLHRILLPFVAGMVLAYLLDPLANRVERLGVNRVLATLFIIALFLLVFILLIMLVAPVLVSQLLALIDNMPGYLARLQTLVADSNRPWLAKIVGEGFANVEIGPLVKQSAGTAVVFLGSVWSGGRALISIFSLIVITPVVAFYLINDWPRITAAIDNWLPRRQADTIRGLMREIDAAIAGFMRGQTGVALVLGSFYGIGFTITGLSFGLLIGLLAGLLSFVPYAGSLTAFVLSVVVAVAQFWPDWTPIVAVVAVNLIGQVLEGNVLSPYLVGPSVGLHPVWLMFALLAFGYLFGFVGLLLAIPMAAAIGVLVRFALRQYLASPFYTGDERR